MESKKRNGAQIQTLDIVVFGLSITSSWGNGHATTFRSLLKALASRGHRITFFEKDVPWYASSRDLPHPPFCTTILYTSPGEIGAHEALIRKADLVIIGSYVSDAQALTRRIGRLSPRCLAFYDIDTPVTLAKLRQGDYEYLHPEMIEQFDLYLSFSGGSSLETLEKLGARRARPLYCSVDESLYYPSSTADQQGRSYTYDLGYLGTYSDDRQATVERLLLEPARRSSTAHFCVAGAKYPNAISWPGNVELIEHIPPRQHRDFYNSQRFTLNVTRQDMIAAGHSPSVRLFEAGACATPVISDYWQGLDSFFIPGEEILVANDTADVERFLEMSEDQRLEMGQRMRRRVLSAHTSTHRAEELEHYWQEAIGPRVRAQASG